jgi:photosystem II stability/assembly factor-like uncharacterized protein
MAALCSVFVGTTGQGSWRSVDGGERWTRLRPALYAETKVRALATHPTDPKQIYVGTEIGLYASAGGGKIWREIESPRSLTLP